MPKTVPADIAAAIVILRQIEQNIGRWQPHEGHAVLTQRIADREAARAALDIVILKHLSDADEIDGALAALDRIEQGV